SAGYLHFTGLAACGLSALPDAADRLAERPMTGRVGRSSVLFWGIRRSAGVGAQPVGSFALAEFRHDLALYLADPLTGQTEQFSDLIESARLPVIQAEPQPDDLLFAFVEGVQHAADIVVQQAGDYGAFGRCRLGILDEITQRGFLVVADRHIQAHRIAAVVE